MTNLLEKPKVTNTLIFERLKEVIPGGVNSPARAFNGVPAAPIIVESAKGDQLTDVESRHFIDLCMSWGALLHGHAHPKIIQAAIERARKGTTFGLSCEVEERLARKIVDIIPSIEKIRFVSTGTEATMYAVRLARGFTGKTAVVKFHGNYHGNADQFLVKAGSGLSRLNIESTSRGIPPGCIQDTICLPYNDVEAVRKLFSGTEASKIAAVIVEPVAGNMGVVPAKARFLETLREETHKHGALLIFDEVITGFRVGLLGAQGMYKIRPDLTCFGKIIGGGFPAAAFGGPAYIMDALAPIGEVYQAGTLSGNPVAMEAGFTAIKMAERDGFYEEMELKTKMITTPVKEALIQKKMNACIQEAGSMFTLFFGVTSMEKMDDGDRLDLEQFGRYFTHMLERGIFLPPSQFEACFISSVHTQKHLEYVRDQILEFLN